MAVLQMQRFSICALKKDRKAILEELQSLGVMEVDISIAEDQSLQKMNTTESRQVFEKHAVMAEHALEVLQKYVPEKTSLFSSLEGKPLVDKSEYDRIVDDRKGMITTARTLVNLNKEISENQAGVAKLENQIESLTPWMSLDIPISYRGTKSTAVFIGTMSKVMTLEEIREAIGEHAPELEAYDIEILSADRDMTYLAAICLKKDAEQLEEALRASGFARPSQLVDKVPAEQKDGLEREVQKLNEKTAALEERIRGFESSRKDLKLVADYYRIRADKYQVLGQLPQSKQTFIISGYVPAYAISLLNEKIGNAYDCSVEVEDIKEEEEAPVLLKNGKVASSVEGVLASFGLPAKGEMDPSSLTAIFYIFLFGLMLSDAAYGLIVFVACFAVLKKFPRMSENMAKSIRLFMYCGLSTLFWGVMFGGFFGDVIDKVAVTFFGYQGDTILKPLWFAPLEEPMRLLIYSMLFGLIHLFVGLGAKGYMCIRDKRYLDFFCDVVLWFMLLIGLILILLPSELFRSISQMEFAFPPAVNTLAKVLAIAGAVGILFMSGRANKNPALRVALGAYDLYNLTGWLSDVLSYSRLLALGLATGVIASVVNQMGTMAGGSIFGLILFVLVFCIGHTFNLAINLLGAYVHTCRLQYVEFFGKFFEGGGKAFTPFKENTKYVDIKEES